MIGIPHDNTFAITFVTLPLVTKRFPRGIIRQRRLAFEPEKMLRFMEKSSPSFFVFVHPGAERNRATAAF